jgi:hypothetical protein
MRNKIAGTQKGTSRTAKYYQDNPDARKKKKEYDTEYHSTKSRREYRSELNKENRERGTYGNGDGKDVAHKSKTKTRMQSQSKNRADKKRSFFK